MKAVPYLTTILLFTIFLPLIAFSQGKEANNWYFGAYAGITFNGKNPPQALYDGLTPNSHNCGSASMSDNNGNLLFYGTGEKIWNKDHETMQNGSLLGTNTSQGAVIVPDPGNPNLYYDFNFEWPGQAGKFHFQYSVIDIRLDNGKGGILPDKKCIRLMNYTTEHLSAVRHANGNDVWVVVHDQGNNAFYSYRVTAQGIEPPKISYAGSIIADLNHAGYLKISPNGKNIAIVVEEDPYWISYSEILDFDPETGIVSDNNIVHFSSSLYDALEFSPDNTLIYLKGWTE